MAFETYKLGIKRLDTTPVGAGGVVLNDNFTAIADLIEDTQTETVVNVVDYGATGDGVTDDSAAFQAAIDALEETGGALYVPSNGSYRVKDIEINSKYQVWIVGDMGNHITTGGVDSSWSAKGTIRPAVGASYLFKWERHASIGFAGFGAGGGIRGLCFTDFNTAGSGIRGVDFQIVELTDAAIWVADALAFTVEGCEFQGLRGTAIKVVLSTYTKLFNNKLYYCGNNSPAKPVIDAGGGASQATLWSEWLWMENLYGTHIKLGANASIRHHNGYHENNVAATADATFIDATDGVAYIYDSFFNNNTGVSIILGGNTGSGTGHVVQGCGFYNFPVGVRTIWVQNAAAYTRLDNLRIGAAGSTAPTIEVDANECTLSNIYTLGGRQ